MLTPPPPFPPLWQQHQNVLKAWSELGAQDPEKLKALLVERRLKTFQGLLLQTVLDFVACGGKFSLSNHCASLSQSFSAFVAASWQHTV
jgi:hypothetical protein